MFLLQTVPFLVLSQTGVQAQNSHLQGNFPPPAKPTVITAREVQTGAIRLDGNLSEGAWIQAEEIRDFFQQEPVQGAQNTHSTSVRVLFDNQYLYFGVVCRDSGGRGGVRVQDLRRDFIFGENDLFAVQLDPQNLKRYCVSFQTTPYGSQRDIQVFDDNFRDNDWDALWQVRTNISDSGWTAEFAIPFATLRYDYFENYAEQQDSVSWGVSFFRLARRDYEQSVFPPVPQSYSPYRMVYAARLRGLKLPKPSVNLRVQPYALYDFTSQKASADAVPVAQGIPKFGGDAKWAVKPDATLDFTFNTDFAQADVDRAVNNLTRFNLFFPERRQFFLENSGVFPEVDNNFVRPFFSRTIGLENTQFAANPVGIDAGVRYVERNSDRALAGMFVRQRATERQSAANFGVARYLQNFGAQNSVGAMLTHRYDDASERLNTGGRHNTTFTADALWRPIDELTVTAMISGSLDNSLAQNGANTSTQAGLAGSVFAGYNSNTMYVGTLHSFATERYLPGMGFVAQSNTVFHNPGGYAIIRPKERTWWRRWDPGVFLELYHNANDGTFQQASADIFPIWFLFQDNAFVRYSVTPTWQNINFDFAPVGVRIEQGRYFYVRHILQYSSDASAQLSCVARSELGGYFNGALTTLYGSLRYAPLPNIALTAEYERNQFFDVGANNANFVTELISGAVRLAASPQLQLSAFYQYNSFDRLARWNVRGSWEFLPLSFLYLVFNDFVVQPEGRQNQALIGKVVYTHQF